MVNLNDLHLGKQSAYQSRYNPKLLTPVPRAFNRDTLGVDPLPFTGVDIWNCYEISWVNDKGKPCVALGRLQVPADSANIVESKSLKLYFNSFNQEPTDRLSLQKTVTTDLSDCVGAPVDFELIALQSADNFSITKPNGICLDELDVACTDFSVNPELLEVADDGKFVSETLYSNLLKSNCLITSQPDWATVSIEYTGKAICHQSLLQYIVSFRQHNEFHEHCVERMFVDIWQRCQPESLTVYARYTRRGGLDINPYRSSESKVFNFERLVRQ